MYYGINRMINLLCQETSSVKIKKCQKTLVIITNCTK